MSGLTRVVPLLTLGGLGYFQRDAISDVAMSPIEVARVAATQFELTQIRRAFAADLASDALPDSVCADFPSYIRSRFDSEGKDPAVDYWGELYRAADRVDFYELWSTGPDRIDDTEDDVYLDVPKR